MTSSPSKSRPLRTGTAAAWPPCAQRRGNGRSRRSQYWRRAKARCICPTAGQGPGRTVAIVFAAARIDSIQLRTDQSYASALGRFFETRRNAVVADEDQFQRSGRPVPRSVHDDECRCHERHSRHPRGPVNIPKRRGLALVDIGGHRRCNAGLHCASSLAQEAPEREAARNPSFRPTSALGVNWARHSI